ncbi:hypothetical protein BT69DRAFT_1315358 [Atractiella rhizophila]|nr:hypothetical protein BT69DRAFT_1315358 [Atractiella rhizophila]
MLLVPLLSVISLAVAAPQATTTAAIPACALSCTTTAATQSSCGGISNITCLCTNESFQAAVYNCYVSTCGNDLAAAIAYGAAVCQQNGNPIDTTAIPTGATATAATSSHASSTSTGAPAATQSGGSGAATLKVGGVLGLLAAGLFALM